MKPFRSLRLRITLLCALLLTLCCAALAVTSNLSAIHLTDTIAAAPLSPALDPEAAAKGTMPLLTTQAAPVVQQAQQQMCIRDRCKDRQHHLQLHLRIRCRGDVV